MRAFQSERCNARHLLTVNSPCQLVGHRGHPSADTSLTIMTAEPCDLVVVGRGLELQLGLVMVAVECRPMLQPASSAGTVIAHLSFRVPNLVQSPVVANSIQHWGGGWLDVGAQWTKPIVPVQLRGRRRKQPVLWDMKELHWW